MSRMQIKFPEKVLFSEKLQVRIGDVNSGSHLGNHVLVSYLNEAMLLCMRHYGFQELEIEGSVFINADLSVIYKSESFLGDLLKIEVSIGNLKKAGCDFYFKVTNENTGKETALARMGMLFFDYENRKIASVPESFRKVFEKLCFNN